MAVLLNDDDIKPFLTPELAMDAVRGVIQGFADGVVAAPARTVADLGEGVMTYTTGVTPDVFGYRSYDSLGPGKVDQIVTCLDRTSRTLKYVHSGALVGTSRTGAIGGVAVDALAPTDATSLAIIGCGVQAYWQAWAIAAARKLDTVRVYSPTEQRRTAFAQRLNDKLELPAVATSSAREAIEADGGAEIVVLATTAKAPVIDMGWLRDGAHVNSLGNSKRPGKAEYDDRLPAESFVTTDSLAQLKELAGSAAGVEHLGFHLEPTTDRFRGKRFTFFQSCGLGGTEVALLDALGNAVTAEK